MNWASIKSALNSTLGTSSFLSLDKMIENSKAFISNKIDGVTTTVNSLKIMMSNGLVYKPSSTEKDLILSGYSGYTDDNDLLCSFQCKFSGVVTIKATGTSFHDSWDAYVNFTKTSVVGNNETSQKYGFSSGATTTITCQFFVHEGDIIYMWGKNVSEYESSRLRIFSTYACYEIG